MYGCRSINNIYVPDGSGRDAIITANPEFRGGRTRAEFLVTPAYEKLRMRNPVEKPQPLDMGERRKLRESCAYGTKVLGMDGLNPMDSFHRSIPRGPKSLNSRRILELTGRIARRLGPLSPRYVKTGTAQTGSTQAKTAKKMMSTSMPNLPKIC